MKEFTRNQWRRRCSRTRRPRTIKSREAGVMGVEVRELKNGRYWKFIFEHIPRKSPIGFSSTEVKETVGSLSLEDKDGAWVGMAVCASPSSKWGLTPLDRTRSHPHTHPCVHIP